MFDSKKLFEKLNNTAKKVVDGAGQVMGNVSESQANKEAENNTSHTMYEVFTAAFGMGKKFVITESSLIYGTEEYTYSQLTPIRIVNPPMPLSNGTASTVANGKELVLAFECSQKDRFAKAMTYANEQIDLANGTVRNYKYVLQSEQGTKIEVYEDYILLYALKSGIGSIVGNSMQGGSGGKVIYFTDMTISLNETAENIVLQIAPQNADIVSIVLNTAQKELAQNIIAYINDVLTTEATQTEFVPEAWEQVCGAEKQFTLNGKTLVIPANMDAFNTYRTKFYELARVCADNARKEYDKKVQNLTTYLEFFPKIYNKHLGVVTQRATDILISESIWTVTKESFTNQHIDDFHMAIEEYLVTTESVELTVQANQNRVSTAMSFVPNLVGGGFGVKGAAKGIATATAFNLVRDGAEAGLLKGASQINQAQQLELYQRINPDNLFELVFIDFWRVFLSLTFTLNQNGKAIWYPTDDLAQQANNIFQNLSNPNFPQDKVLDVFFDILKTNPYVEDYHNFMFAKFGDTAETQAIKNYFNV